MFTIDTAFVLAVIIPFAVSVVFFVLSIIALLISAACRYVANLTDWKWSLSYWTFTFKDASETLIKIGVAAILMAGLGIILHEVLFNFYS